MPLVKGKTKSAFRENVSRLVKEGYPKKQAVAIAYDIQRSAKKKK